MAVTGSTAVDQARAELAGQLTAAGFRAADHIPDRITPPMALVLPADEYLTPGDVFDGSEWVLGLVVVLLAEPGDNRSTTEALDRMLTGAIGATAGGWDVQPIKRPYIATVGAANYLAADIELSTTVDL